MRIPQTISNQGALTMRTIHYSANSVMPNTTGVVVRQLLDLDEPEPTVSLVPIIGWALADGVQPQALFMWNIQCDAMHDPATGHVHTQYGECWSSLADAVSHLVLMHRSQVRLSTASKKLKPRAA
jgi:hypothetical protein